LVALINSTGVEVDAIVGKHDPKTLTPVHYFLTGLATDVSDLESADEWMNDQEKVHHVAIQENIEL
jgi:hypothetical protein